MSDVEYGSFDDIEEVEYAKLSKNGSTLTFLSSNFIVEQNQYKNKSWVFSVSEEGNDKLLSITSKRLMLKLKEYHPLSGKTFEIKRKGFGMDTDYDLEESVE